MHLEIQVALNFVISYLYNKLPRRRVNIFGEELEKALKDKFNGHWYPDKPFKGSAFRCLKTGDPIDAVLERAARESGVPITDILENLPNELSVWVDPGEVSYRIGEKGIIKILYSETNDNQEDNNSADREVNKTFNPEAQCFRPIDAVTTNINNLSLSPKTSPLTGSSPLSTTSISPTYKSSPNSNGPMLNGGTFMQRSQAPLTFTTATFAQTKFGSTKLKTSSKRANSSYRMSPTEFSNYIKQRAMQQQMHHNLSPVAVTSTTATGVTNHFGPIGSVSPARSISPNPLAMNLTANGGCNNTVNGNGIIESPYYTYPNMAAIGMYASMNGHRNMFDTHFHADSNTANAAVAAAAAVGLYGGLPSNGTGIGKYSNFLDSNGYFNANGHLTPSQQQSSNGGIVIGTVGGGTLGVRVTTAATTITATAVTNGPLNTNNNLLSQANDLIQSSGANLIDLHPANSSIIGGHKASINNNNNNSTNNGKNIMVANKSNVNITVTSAPLNDSDSESTTATIFNSKGDNERQQNSVLASTVNMNGITEGNENIVSVNVDNPLPLTTITGNENDNSSSNDHSNATNMVTTSVANGTNNNTNTNNNNIGNGTGMNGDGVAATVSNSNLQIVVDGNGSSTQETNSNAGTSATNAVASNTKLMVDGLNAFYSSATGTTATYQQLLVAN